MGHKIDSAEALSKAWESYGNRNGVRLALLRYLFIWWFIKSSKVKIYPNNLHFSFTFSRNFPLGLVEAIMPFQETAPASSVEQGGRERPSAEEHVNLQR